MHQPKERWEGKEEKYAVFISIFWTSVPAFISTPNVWKKNTICRRSHPKPLLHVSGRYAAADAYADTGSHSTDAGDGRRHRGSPGRHRRRRLWYITEYQNAAVADHQDDTSFPSLHLTPPARFRRALTAIDDPLHPTCPGPDAARTKRWHRCIDLRCDACHHHWSVIVVRDGSAAPARGGAAWLRSSSMTFVSARGLPACQAIDRQSQVHTLYRYTYLLTAFSP